MVVARLSKIDELHRPEHYLLTDEDECYYFGEYTAKKGYSYSETNDLISNFKKEMKHRGTQSWYYKQRAIKTAATWLRSLDCDVVENDATFVPIPPSKTQSHPEHDDRMIQTLRQAFKSSNADIRELVIQTVDMEADHAKGEDSSRATVQELYDSYLIDQDLVQGTRDCVVLLDDVLTNGTHFKAAQRRMN